MKVEESKKTSETSATDSSTIQRSLEKPSLQNPQEGYDAEAAILAKSATTIRVVSYNILSSFLFKAQADTPPELARLSWDYRKEIMLGLISKVAPDILSLQEVTLEQIQFLREHLGAKYGFVGFAANTGHSLPEIAPDEYYGEIVPIIFNATRFDLLDAQVFWLSETPDRISKGWDASRPRVVTAAAFRDKLTSQTFVVGNTHYDHMGSEALLQSGTVEASVLLAFQLKHKADFALLNGDRNCFTDGQFQGEKWYQNMLDATQAMDTRMGRRHVGLATTFFGYTPDKFKAQLDEHKTIDLIFAKGCQVVQSMCLSGEYALDETGAPQLLPLFGKIVSPAERLFASDHALIAADVEPNSSAPSITTG